jgi:MFS family permease
LFAITETRLSRAPLVPFSAFRSRLLSAGNTLSFLSFAPVMATWFFLTLYLQEVRGYTALQAGLIFLPISLAVAAGAQASFTVIALADARLPFLAGGGIAAAGLAWLAQLSPGGALWAVIVPACLTMAGGGLMFAPITTAATSGAPPGQEGLASGLLNTSRQVGGAVGLAILATIAGAHHGGSPASLTAGFRPAFVVGAAIFAATALTGALILPRILGRPAHSEPGSPHARQHDGTSSPDARPIACGSPPGRPGRQPLADAEARDGDGARPRAVERLGAGRRQPRAGEEPDARNALARSADEGQPG